MHKAICGMPTNAVRLRWQIIALSILSACLILQAGCTSFRPALYLPRQSPVLTDDSDAASLAKALDNHRDYLSRLPPQRLITIGSKTYSASALLQAQRTFRAILENNNSAIEQDEALRQHFTLYKAGGRQTRPRGEMLVTAYYEPLMEASLTRQDPFIFPLYGMPADLITVTSKNGKQQVRRRTEKNTLVPYWTREQIEEENVLSGHELVYLKSRFDAFTLHVQGSGVLSLPDGSRRTVSYAGNNGYYYSSVGKKLVDDGKLRLEETTMQRIRQYLADHPDEEKTILYHNKRYIFFSLSNNSKPPFGSLGVPLTAGRSIAIDGKTLPHGVIAYLVSRIPVIDDSGSICTWKSLHRFVLPQDSGAAIQGSGRVDLFLGNGAAAEAAAGIMKEEGELYFLLPRDTPETHI